VRAAAVIGRPVGHSLSPLIHTAWLEAAGIDGRYLALAPETAAEFRALLEEQAFGALVGCNVTAPYKGDAHDWAVERGADLGPEARAAESVNLLVLDGDIRAESTDGLGMIGAIHEQAPELDLAAGLAVVLGAGGAARAAVHALKSEGARDIRIVNRTVDRARELSSGFDDGVSAWALADAEAALMGSQLLINAASIIDPPDLAPMSAGGAVLDMTYRPLETPLLARARARGLTPVDGLAMLIGQARPSFEALFGAPAPEIDIRAVCLKRLEAER
jgi:shikimate dehydrogenase